MVFFADPNFSGRRLHHNRPDERKCDRGKRQYRFRFVEGPADVGINGCAICGGRKFDSDGHDVLLGPSEILSAETRD